MQQVPIETIHKRVARQFPKVKLDSSNSVIDIGNESIIQMLKNLVYYTRNNPDRDNKDNFRIKGFEKAISSLKEYDGKITSGKEAGKLSGIGKGTAERIQTFLELGYLPELEDLRKKVDTNINAEIESGVNLAIKNLTTITGIGPERAKKLYNEHGICTVRELILAYKAGDVKLTHHIQVGLKYRKDLATRIPYSEMIELEARMHSLLETYDPLLKLQICGSYRRQCPDSGDIDCLVTWPFVNDSDYRNNGVQILSEMVEHLKNAGFIVANLTEKGKTKYMGVCRLSDDYPGRRIDIRLVYPESWGCAVLYFTGSGEFNCRMRKLALDRGMTLNEYGLYGYLNGQKTYQVVTSGEKDVFYALNMEYTEPHLRKL